MLKSTTCRYSQNRVLAALSAAGLMIALTAFADAPRFGDKTFADNKDGDSPQEIFAPETAEIFLRAELVDIPKDTQLRAIWFAEKTDTAPPNFKIDTSNVTVGIATSVATFSLSKPSNGWPQGDYRVELSINEKPVEQVRFKVQKQ